MNLAVIGMMSLAAFLARFFRAHRREALLLISVVALYLLQPVGLETALPTATLLLVIGVWWIITPQASQNDYRFLVEIVLVASGVILWKTSNAASFSFLIVPVLPLTALTTVSLGAFVPRTDAVVRKRLALAFILLIVGLLVVVKLPALQNLITTAAVHSTAQPIYPDWQWLGFSYIAFRLMHVLLDYRSDVFYKRLQTISAQNISIRDFALYVIFFPAIPAGPIDRYEHFVRELDSAPNSDSLTNGLIRIGIGLFKKFILADTLAYIALSPTLLTQTKPGMVLPLWVMLYAYAFRLFFDFSGYTDIAIGIGLLAGLKLPENFTAPYAKRNITAFWNSWHITLSTWFRNYFFTPLSRELMKTRIKSQRNLIIFIAQVSTMVLIGLWHGIALNFVLWGVWHGIGLWFHKWLTDHTRAWDQYVNERPMLARTVHVLSILATFHFVAIGWIFFALPDLNLITKALAGLVGLHG